MFYGEPGTLPRPTGCQLPHAVVPHREFHLLRRLRAALLPPSPKGRLPSSASWRIPRRSRTSIGSTDRPRSVVREPRSDGPLRYAVEAARRMRAPHELGTSKERAQRPENAKGPHGHVLPAAPFVPATGARTAAPAVPAPAAPGVLFPASPPRPPRMSVEEYRKHVVPFSSTDPPFVPASRQSSPSTPWPATMLPRTCSSLAATTSILNPGHPVIVPSILASRAHSNRRLPVAMIRSVARRVKSVCR